ncbi:hypothetical protein Q3G72_029427 [Acer saccharum]|nr:hypothetical protein Q3G72_029427 [Acer saccharum]
MGIMRVTFDCDDNGRKVLNNGNKHPLNLPLQLYTLSREQAHELQQLIGGNEKAGAGARTAFLLDNKLLSRHVITSFRYIFHMESNIEHDLHEN